MSAAPNSHAVAVSSDFWSFFSRQEEGGDIMKYAYMAPGDRFGAITQLPEYYVTGDELRTLKEKSAWLASLLRKQSRRSAEGAGTGRVHVVEWGPGPAHIVEKKTLPLLRSLADGPSSLSYEAVDVSIDYARESAAAVDTGLASDGTLAATGGTVGDFMEHAAGQASKDDGSMTCMLFWGVTFGNFDGAGLRRLIAGIKAYDSACFTVDHNLDIASLRAAYDNAECRGIISGALEYFQSVLDEDASVSVSGFDLSAWDIEFCFEPQHYDSSGAVDELLMAGYVCSRRDQTMVFEGIGPDLAVVHVAAGDRFRVIQSRKYSEQRVRQLIDSVPSEQPKRVVASGIFGEGSRVGLIMVSGGSSDACDEDSEDAGLEAMERLVNCGA